MRYIAAVSCFLAAFCLILTTACTPSGIALVNLPTLFTDGYSIHEAKYGTDTLQALDVYVPKEDGNAKHAVIIFLHGGRWQTGNKKDYRFVGAALAKRGYVTVIPDYRQYPDVRFPVFVEDAAKAVAWVDDHIAEYGGRSDRIHLSGHSSGAHIGALLVVDKKYLAKESKNSHLVFRDFAGLAGPYDFTPEESDLIDIFGPPERYSQMQATTFIDGNEPPMLLMYGNNDSTVEAYNHERLADSILGKGGKVKVITYSGLGHIGLIGTFSALGPKTKVVDDMTNYFRTNDER